MDYAYYSYGIDKITQNDNNGDLIDIHYGGDRKVPISIFKTDFLDFIKAIISKEEREERRLTDEILSNTGSKYVIGRAMILMTDFDNYLEYANAGQNGIIRIAGMDIHGRINMEESFDYKNRQPDFSELYPKKKM